MSAGQITVKGTWRELKCLAEALANDDSKGEVDVDRLFGLIKSITSHSDTRARFMIFRHVDALPVLKSIICSIQSVPHLLLKGFTAIHALLSFKADDLTDNSWGYGRSYWYDICDKVGGDNCDEGRQEASMAEYRSLRAFYTVLMLVGGIGSIVRLIDSVRKELYTCTADRSAADDCRKRTSLMVRFSVDSISAEKENMCLRAGMRCNLPYHRTQSISFSTKKIVKKN
jgi:hypothetical protein